MDNNKRKVLELLSEGKITVEEAERLMTLVQSEAPTGQSVPESRTGRGLPKYLRVEVRPNPQFQSEFPENVNIRVPIALLKAGIKLTSLIPPGAFQQMDSSLKEKGIDFDLRNIKPENLEEILANLNDLEVDVHNGKQNVRIYAE